MTESLHEKYLKEVQRLERWLEAEERSPSQIALFQKAISAKYAKLSSIEYPDTGKK